MGEVKRLRERLKKAYGDGVYFASECQQVILSGENPYTGRGEPFVEASVAWTIPILLTIFSAYGAGAKGAQTTTFSKVSERLRTAKMHWSDDLSIQVERSGEILKKLPVQAVWSSKYNALLARRECQDNPALLSAAFEALLEREDLEVPIKLVLGRLKGSTAPEEEAIIESLSELRIDRSRFEVVRQTLRGDLESVKHLISLAVLLYCPEFPKGRIQATNSESAILVELQAAGLHQAEAQILLETASRASGTQHFGQILSNTDPARFTLGAWNDVLASAGEPRVRNEDAEDQFRGHYISARVALLSVLRRIAKDGALMSFADMMKKVLEPQAPENIGFLYWEVPFWVSMSQAALLLGELGARAEEEAAVRSSHSLPDLIGALDVLGLDPRIDPITIYAKNAASCREILDRLRKVAVSWCVKHSVEPTGWDFIEAGEKARSCLDDRAYIKELNEEELFSLLRACLPTHASQKPFRDMAGAASRVSDLISSLSYTDEDLNGSSEVLEKYLKEQRLKKRRVNVAGRDFDPIGNNLEDLWGHVSSCIQETNISAISPEDIVPLDIMPESEKKSSGGAGGGGGTRTKTPYVSETTRRLIGTVGEIHAFRALKKKHGKELVHAGCWKSELSLKVFPGNPGVSDQLGYDFELVIDGIKYLIEVKSSEGEDDFFKLGPTEVVKATDVATSRKTKYRILRVTNALSESPGFYFLPNPFERKYHAMFTVRGTDFNVTYGRHSETDQIPSEVEASPIQAEEAVAELSEQEANGRAIAHHT